MARPNNCLAGFRKPLIEMDPHAVSQGDGDPSAGVIPAKLVSPNAGSGSPGVSNPKTEYSAALALDR